MGGGHGHGDGVTYKGVTLHQPKRWHTVTGKGLCAVMCFSRGNSFYSLIVDAFFGRGLKSSWLGFGFSIGQSKMVLWCWAGGILGKAMMIIIRPIYLQIHGNTDNKVSSLDVYARSIGKVAWMAVRAVELLVRTWASNLCLCWASVATLTLAIKTCTSIHGLEHSPRSMNLKTSDDG
ncbi:NADH dehydrogenase [ubiquinone] 1 beta subcomplex subunit [Sesamum angolense]|uniref:NADH dehydrogenase [ubiquinone] 1 beta subcomplex subunit n=1 Tax=Sesamum angolense TaxID=2727404 RepID=A0AAE1W601_9LAMI|nr:NADH dehydrogenase [ubiquinone] 1 beta subcomplex subunit [Sesamum angolense]